MSPTIKTGEVCRDLRFVAVTVDVTGDLTLVTFRWAGEPRGGRDPGRPRTINRVRYRVGEGRITEIWTHKANYSDVFGRWIRVTALYRLFPDKEALLREVVAERFADFDRHLDAAAGDADSPCDDLRQRSHGYLAYAVEHPGHYRLLFSASHLGPVAVGRADGGHPGAASFFRFVQAVQACLDAGAETDHRRRLLDG